jgi:putative transposase
MVSSVPPKYSIAITIGYLKSKSAIRIHRQQFEKKGTLFGGSFWARGYSVTTVGCNEHKIKVHIKVIGSVIKGTRAI